MAKVHLPGWRGEYGVDFSRYGIDGTNCWNCRSLVKHFGVAHCTNPDFIAQAIPEQGKLAGDDVIPVESGDPARYCCNAWALSKTFSVRVWAP